MSTYDVILEIGKKEKIKTYRNKPNLKMKNCHRNYLDTISSWKMHRWFILCGRKFPKKNTRIPELPANRYAVSRNPSYMVISRNQWSYLEYCHFRFRWFILIILQSSDYLRFYNDNRLVWNVVPASFHQWTYYPVVWPTTTKISTLSWRKW